MLKLLVGQTVSYSIVLAETAGRRQSLCLFLWSDTLRMNFVCSLGKQTVILAVFAKPSEFVVSGRYVVGVILKSRLNTMRSAQSPSRVALQNLLLLRYSLSASLGMMNERSPLKHFFPVLKSPPDNGCCLCICPG